MDHSPSYYRARTATIENWLKVSPFLENGKINNDKVLLRNAVIPDRPYYNLQDSIENRLHQNKHEYPDTPLTFTEITSYSTWFAMHPEKVAGKEEVTTSLHFPITVKGSKDNIIQTISKGLSPDTTLPNSELELEAMALEVELELMDLERLGNFENKHGDFLKEFEQKIFEWTRKTLAGKKIKNPFLKNPVLISENSLRKNILHKKTGQGKDKYLTKMMELLAIENLPKFIKEGILTKSEEKRKNTKNHTLTNSLHTGTGDFLITIIVRETTSGQFFYSFRITVKKI